MVDWLYILLLAPSLTVNWQTVNSGKLWETWPAQHEGAVILVLQDPPKKIALKHHPTLGSEYKPFIKLSNFCPDLTLSRQPDIWGKLLTRKTETKLNQKKQPKDTKTMKEEEKLLKICQLPQRKIASMKEGMIFKESSRKLKTRQQKFEK